MVTTDIPTNSLTSAKIFLPSQVNASGRRRPNGGCLMSWPLLDALKVRLAEGVGERRLEAEPLRLKVERILSQEGSQSRTWKRRHMPTHYSSRIPTGEQSRLPRRALGKTRNTETGVNGDEAMMRAGASSAVVARQRATEDGFDRRGWAAHKRVFDLRSDTDSIDEDQ